MTNGISSGRPTRVAVVRALGGLGDLLCAVPALRALRAGIPNAEIVLIGLPEARPIMGRFPNYVDRVLEMPGWPGLPEGEPDPRRVPGFLATAVAERFDLALQMHGSGVVTNRLTALLGAKVSTGYYLPGTWRPDPDRYLPWTGRQPEPRCWLELVDRLGMPLKGEYLEFPVFDDDREAFADLARRYGLSLGGYVCVHAGAGDGRTRWPAERFAKVADALADRGYEVVLTGTPREREAIQAVRMAMHREATDLAGHTSLGMLGALLEGAQVLVCNDTGVSHVAAALSTPSVVVFNDSDPARWAPANRRLHRIVLDAPSGRRVGAWKGCSDVVQSVIAEADALLASGTAAVHGRPTAVVGGGS